MKLLIATLLALLALGTPPVVNAQAVTPLRDAGFADAALSGFGASLLDSRCLDDRARFFVPMSLAIAEMEPSAQFTAKKARYITDKVEAALERAGRYLHAFHVVARRQEFGSHDIAKELIEKRAAGGVERVDWFIQITADTDRRVDVRSVMLKTNGEQCWGPQRAVALHNMPDVLD
jgi:hypothetical protein